jgi:hypothetical protein
MFPVTWGGSEKFSIGLLYGGIFRNYDFRLPSALKFVAWAPKKKQAERGCMAVFLFIGAAPAKRLIE